MSERAQDNVQNEGREAGDMQRVLLQNVQQGDLITAIELAAQKQEAKTVVSLHAGLRAIQDIGPELANRRLSGEKIDNQMNIPRPGIEQSDSEEDEEPSHRRRHSLFGGLGAPAKQSVDVNESVVIRPLQVIKPPEPIYALGFG